MGNGKPMLFPLSIAHLAGLTAIQMALLFLFIDVRLSAVPLGAFLLACFVAPFFPELSFFLPVVSKGSRKELKVALSFDDGPDPEVTPRLLDLLDLHSVQAAFFLVGEKAEAYPELVKTILDRGHEIGNHSWDHHPFLVLKRRTALREEIARAQEVFRDYGIRPRAFRPPAGVVTPKLWPVLLEQGMFCANFSCRAWDAGNRRIDRLAERILAKVRPGDFVLLHDVYPSKGDANQLVAEFDTLLVGLKRHGLKIVPPSILLGRAFMARCPKPQGAAESFYDDLAATYDHEQFKTPVAISRNLELKLFRSRIPDLLRGARRVLEVGAGTGIFTLELAHHCQEVHAIDLSGNMLQRLKQKAQERGFQNIWIQEGNAEMVELAGPYSAVVAFLAFEYFQDLPAFFVRLAPHMEPGGRIYFTTSRRSFFRLFTQVGNALRQGLWLRARTRHEVLEMLQAAGVAEIRCESHLLKTWFSKGMLLEVEGRWPGGSDHA